MMDPALGLRTYRRPTGSAILGSASKKIAMALNPKQIKWEVTVSVLIKIVTVSVLISFLLL